MVLPPKFSALKPQGPSTGRPKGRPKGAKNKPDTASRGRGGEDAKSTRRRQPQTQGHTRTAGNLFAIDLDEIRGVVADGGDTGAAPGHEIRDMR